MGKLKERLGTSHIEFTPLQIKKAQHLFEKFKVDGGSTEKGRAAIKEFNQAFTEQQALALYAQKILVLPQISKAKLKKIIKQVIRDDEA